MSSVTWSGRRKTGRSSIGTSTTASPAVVGRTFRSSTCSLDQVSEDGVVSFARLDLGFQELQGQERLLDGAYEDALTTLDEGGCGKRR